MNFRVQRLESEAGSVVFYLSGRIQAEHTETLRELLGKENGRAALDLKELILVDRDAVRFFARCEARGIALTNCPAYIREWVLREAEYDRAGSNGRDGNQQENTR